MADSGVHVWVKVDGGRPFKVLVTTDDHIADVIKKAFDESDERLPLVDCGSSVVAAHSGDGESVEPTTSVGDLLAKCCGGEEAPLLLRTPSDEGMYGCT